MVVYVVQYHSNAWGDQESSDEILGVYDNEEAANKRAEEFEKDYAFDDDIVSVIAYNLNEEVKTYKEIE